MTLKFLGATLLCATAVICLPAGAGRAQDKGLSPNNKGLSPDESVEINHADPGAGDEKTPPADHDPKPKVAARDSMMSHNKAVPIASPAVKQKPGGQKPAERKTSPNPEEQEDPLSFNFLYYVIQKFKISDLIDE